MHKTNYRPIRSQQLTLIELIQKKYDYSGRIVVHHVLEDSFYRLYIQIEIQHPNYVKFERVEL